MEKADRYFIEKGTKLRHLPSGLLCEVLNVGWDTHYVRFPRGAEVSIKIAMLEVKPEILEEQITTYGSALIPVEKPE